MYHQWRTHSPMDKHKELIRRSCEVLNRGFWFPYSAPRVVGWRSYLLCYGVSTLLQTDQQVIHRFLWFMGQKQSFLVISVMIHPGLRRMLKRIMRGLDRTLWTGSMKSETEQLLSRRFTNKIFVATTVAGSGPEPFKREIWCFDSFKIKPRCINYPRLGKGLSSSARICITGRTT